MNNNEKKKQSLRSVGPINRIVCCRMTTIGGSTLFSVTKLKCDTVAVSICVVICVESPLQCARQSHTWLIRFFYVWGSVKCVKWITTNETDRAQCDSQSIRFPLFTLINSSRSVCVCLYWNATHWIHTWSFQVFLVVIICIGRNELK